MWWMQDYQFRDPVVIIKCQAYTGAVAATVRDQGVCEVSGGGVRGEVSGAESVGEESTHNSPSSPTGTFHCIPSAK